MSDALSRSTWSVGEWNRRLLAHYFSQREGDGQSVTSLLITPEELARAVESSEQEAESVRNTFVDCIRSATIKNEGLLERFAVYRSASANGASSLARIAPDFVAHLIFTCIAAAESSDDLGDEDSYLKRLNELATTKVSADELSLLPTLWEYLADWLSLPVNATRYRELRLPDLGGLTRIGYTVKLTFPDRRDQEALASVLGDFDSELGDPPVGPVLRSVSAAKGEFRRRFVSEFEDFRRLFGTDELPGNRLREHPFWSAVLDAVRHGRRQSVSDLDVAAEPRFQILAEISDDQLTLNVVTDQGHSPNERMVAERLPTALGPWSWALAVPERNGESESKTDRVDALVDLVLSGQEKLRAIDRLVGDGVLLFSEATHGLLELTTSSDIFLVGYALVQRKLSVDFLRLFGTPESSLLETSHGDWLFANRVRVFVCTTEELARTTLVDVSSVQRGLAPTRLRAVRGIRVDSAWLGLRDLLPRIQAGGSGELFLKSDSGEELSLARDADGLWRLPDRELTSNVEIVQRNEGATVDRLHLSFVARPSSENYKSPNDARAWWIEGFGSSISLASIPLSDSSNQDWSWLSDDSVLLGPNVGEFVNDFEQAAWQLFRFSGKWFFSRACIRGESALPRRQVDDDGARRKWRSLLLKALVDPSDPSSAEARSSIRNAAQKKELQRIPRSDTTPFKSLPKMTTPEPALRRFVEILVSRANSRAGLSMHVWYSGLGACFGLQDPRLLRSISRALEEAGLVNIISSMRWRSRAVFPIPPKLVAFRCASGYGATLVGLALESTILQIEKSCDNARVLHERRGSYCPWVPTTVCLRTDTLDAVRRIANEAAVDFEVAQFDLTKALTLALNSVHTSPPANYGEGEEWSHWSLNGSTIPDTRFFRYRRTNAPDFWRAEVGSESCWAHDLNSARLWASKMARMPQLLRHDLGLAAETAYMPLMLARLLSTIGGYRSGPVASGSSAYIYPWQSPKIQSWLLDQIDRISLNGEHDAHNFSLQVE